MNGFGKTKGLDECAQCGGMCGPLASNRDPEELCDVCYNEGTKAPPIQGVSQEARQPFTIAALEAEDNAIFAMLAELHCDVPESERPMSFSDLSVDQANRARNAVRAVNAAINPVDKALSLSVEEVRRDERAKIVAWLRAQLLQRKGEPLVACLKRQRDWRLSNIADAIERGEHARTLLDKMGYHKAD